MTHRLRDGGGVGVIDVLKFAPVTGENVILSDTEVVVSKPWNKSKLMKHINRPEHPTYLAPNPFAPFSLPLEFHPWARMMIG